MALSRHSSSSGSDSIRRMPSYRRSRQRVSSSDSSSDTSDLNTQIRHKHNNYSCYIHLINKSNLTLELVDSKQISGKWAAGSPPQEIEPQSHTLIELTDPKGPHGSEGWCSYRLHHPKKHNAVTFQLRFKDPYWAKDDNFLRASTQYPDWVSLNILKYQTSGHPFIAYVEIDINNADEASSTSATESEASSKHSTESSTGSLLQYEIKSDVQSRLDKVPIQTILPVDSNSDSGDEIDTQHEQPVTSIVVSENEASDENESETGVEDRVPSDEQTEMQNEKSQPLDQPSTEQKSNTETDTLVPIKQLAPDHVKSQASNVIWEPTEVNVSSHTGDANTMEEPTQLYSAESLKRPIKIEPSLPVTIPGPTEISIPSQTQPEQQTPEPATMESSPTVETPATHPSLQHTNSDYSPPADPAKLPSPSLKPEQQPVSQDPVNEKGNTGISSPSPSPLLHPSPTLHLGIVALVFLTTYGFTAARISSRLLSQGLRW